MRTTHIAGLDVTIDDHRLRQLCAWCGYQLINHDLTRVAVPIGQDPTPPVWPHGALVTVDGALSHLANPDGAPDQPYRLPDDACSRREESHR